MPNANGVPTSPTDLLSKLATFLVANGWTQDLNAAEGSGQRAHFHLGGLYAHLRASVGEQVWPNMSFLTAPSNSLNLYCGSGFNSANAWDAQASGFIVPLDGANPVGVAMELGAGPYSTYYFFCDSGGDNVVVIVEKTPGVFVHLGWGSSLKKAGAWTGGMYFFGCMASFFSGAPGSGAGLDSSADCPGVNGGPLGVGSGGPGCVCFVRADVDSYTGKWISIGGVAGAQGKNGDTSVLGLATVANPAIPVYAYQVSPFQLQYCQTSLQDGRANLLPVLLYVQRDGVGAGMSLLGSIPNIFSTNAVGNGYPKATVYSIGAKSYRLFPNFAVAQT